jgi:integrase
MACIAKRRNRYVIDFYDNQGKRRWKTLPKGTTKKKAKESMREIEDQIARGIYLPDKKIPLFPKLPRIGLNLKSRMSDIQAGRCMKCF